jgi:hypothetical protein
VNISISTMPIAYDQAPDWFQALGQKGSYLKHGAIATLFRGIYLHMTSLFVGRQLFCGLI